MWKKTFAILNEILAGFGFACLLLIVGGFFLFHTIGPSIAKAVPDYFSELSEYKYNELGPTYSSTARSATVYLVKDCKRLDEYCYLNEIFLYMSKFSYVPVEFGAAVYPIEQTLKDQAGDCKNLAYTFKTLLDQVDMKNKVIISDDGTHAYNEVFIDNNIFRVDLTIPRLELLFNYNYLFHDCKYCLWKNVDLPQNISFYEYLMVYE